MIRALYGIFPTADGWLALVGVPPPLWAGFCRALGREDLIDDARFATLFQQSQDIADLRRICEEVFPTRTTEEWCARLRAEGQRYGAVRDYAQVVADPQSWANGYLAKGEHPDLGEVSVIGCPIVFSETPARTAVVTPELGQHTEEVLLEAGFTWDELEDLRAHGAW